MIKGEIAKLPAQVQQALPHVQRQGHAFDFQMAAVFQLRVDVAHFKSRAEILPARVELAGRDGHAGRGFDLLQHLRAPGVQMRQYEAQPAYEQRDNHDQRCPCKQ
ncbi:hypothetical protein D3C76_1490880 [compost metagenome]